MLFQTFDSVDEKGLEELFCFMYGAAHKCSHYFSSSMGDEKLTTH